MIIGSIVNTIPGTNRTKKIIYFLGEAITAFDGINQEPEFQEDELLDARFVTMEEAEKLMPYEDHYNKPRIEMLRKADRLLKAEKRDKEFCRGADKVLVQLKDLAVHDGMECRQKESEVSKGHIILHSGNLIVECTNLQHYNEIEVAPEDLNCENRYYDVVSYYMGIIEKYSEDDMCISIDNSCSVCFDNPGLAVEIIYDDVFPKAEELKKVMDLLIDKMNIYEPVIRAIAAGRPVPRDGSEASRFYYDVFLKSERYQRLNQFADE